MKAVFRPARPADLPAVRALVEACGLSVDGVEDQFGDGYVVAEANGELVGVAGMEAHGTRGLLRSVAVKSSAQGSGLGGDLVKERLEWARHRGLESIHLLTTTADAFFTRHGFQVVDRATAPAEIRASREFSEMCPSTAVFMKFTKGGA